MPTARPGSGILVGPVAGTPGPGRLPRPGPDIFVVRGLESEDLELQSVLLGSAVIASFGVFRWGVPAFAFSVPGLIVIIAVLAQIGGGLAWIPLVRRKIGAFGGPRSRRLAKRG